MSLVIVALDVALSDRLHGHEPPCVQFTDTHCPHQSSSDDAAILDTITRRGYKHNIFDTYRHAIIRITHIPSEQGSNRKR